MSRHTKFDEKTNALLCQILSRCYIISTTTKADAFCSYHPHVSQIDIYIYPDGFDSSEDCFFITENGEEEHLKSAAIYFGVKGHFNYGIKGLENAMKKLDELYDKFFREIDEEHTDEKDT